jgi:hypothetical protein
MGLFTKIEQSIAGELSKVLTDAKELAVHASAEAVKLEADLVAARKKAADLAAQAHQAALAAVEKAKTELANLVAEAQAAEQKAKYQAGLVSIPVTTTAPVSASVVATGPVLFTNTSNVGVSSTSNNQ